MQNSAPARIVIIDDHPDHLDYLAALLNRAGYIVTAFEDAAAALSHVARHPVHLVITDIFMPEPDGFEVLKVLQRDYPTLPLIAVGGSFRHDRQLFLDGIRELGACAAFSKPIDAPALLATVAGLLGASPKN